MVGVCQTLQAKVSATPSGPTHSYLHTPIIFFWSKLPRVLAVTQQNVWTRLSSFTDVQLLPSLWGGITAWLWDRGWAQLHMPWAPRRNRQWRNLVPTFRVFADCSWANPTSRRGEQDYSCRQLTLWCADLFEAWISQGGVPPWVWDQGLYQCFRKTLCLQVRRTPHLELLPPLATSGDSCHCEQESMEKHSSHRQGAKSPSQRGCQPAVSFPTPLNSLPPQPCVGCNCSKMFPRAFPKPLHCLSTAADDIPRVTLILVQEAEITILRSPIQTSASK